MFVLIHMGRYNICTHRPLTTPCELSRLFVIFPAIRIGTLDPSWWYAEYFFGGMGANNLLLFMNLDRIFTTSASTKPPPLVFLKRSQRWRCLFTRKHLNIRMRMNALWNFVGVVPHCENAASNGSHEPRHSSHSPTITVKRRIPAWFGAKSTIGIFKWETLLDLEGLLPMNCMARNYFETR